MDKMNSSYQIGNDRYKISSIKNIGFLFLLKRLMMAIEGKVRLDNGMQDGLG